MAIETALRKALLAATEPGSGRSLRDVCADCEIAQATLSDFVHKRGSLRIDQVERLATALGYTARLERKEPR